MTNANIRLLQTVVAALPHSVQKKNDRPLLVRIIVRGNKYLIPVALTTHNNHAIQEARLMFATKSLLSEKENNYQKRYMPRQG